MAIVIEAASKQILDADPAKSNQTKKDIASLKQDTAKRKQTKIIQVQKQSESKKLAKDTSAKILPFDSLEVSARKKVLKLTDDWFKRLKKFNKKDRFAGYIKTSTALYDPHS
jgi:hypothetical protein